MSSKPPDDCVMERTRNRLHKPQEHRKIVEAELPTKRSENKR